MAIVSAQLMAPGDSLSPKTSGCRHRGCRALAGAGRRAGSLRGQVVSFTRSSPERPARTTHHAPSFTSLQRCLKAWATSVKTPSAVKACMQRLLWHGDGRLLQALTHGVHAMPAHNAKLRGG
jgi:hypothetical protein